MATTTFKGARYLVKFAGDWDADTTYEAITSVKHNAFTYISKQPVPAGVAITNTDFWLLWADPNAQMAELRMIIGNAFDIENTISDFAENTQDSIDGINGKIGNGFDAVNTVAKAIADILDMIGSGFDDANTVANAIDDLNEKLGNGFDSANTVTDAVNTIVSPGWVTTPRIADEAVTYDKIDFPLMRSTGTLEENTIYIDASNGDDDNDGLTNLTPLKTLTQAIDNIMAKNIASSRIELMASGNYVLSGYTNISNINLHIVSASGANCTIIFEDTTYFSMYNMHLNIKGTSSNKIKIIDNTAYGIDDDKYWWFDNSTIELTYVILDDFVAFFGSDVRMDNIELSRLYFVNSRCNIRNGFKLLFNWTTNNLWWLNMVNSTFSSTGAATINDNVSVSDNSSQDLVILQGSRVYFGEGFIPTALTNKYRYLFDSIASIIQFTASRWNFVRGNAATQTSDNLREGTLGISAASSIISA